MSLVTNVVIIVDVPLDDDELPYGFLGVLPFTGSYDIQERFRRIDDEYAGGYKALEIDMFACAFNYLNQDELIRWFRQLNWRDGDEAVMIISPQPGGFTFVKAEN